MKKLSEGIIQFVTSILAAIVVSLYFASRGSGDYTLLVFIVAFFVFIGSGVIVKIMYLLIQWKNRYITNVMVYTLSGAVIWVLLIYFPAV
ncbi:hypothetical protein H0266_14260 [Halobacillus locisalis]|uniref:Uncharacterized protein n=1 Tax=Halobacillus locisalis TaxID=220753 RepID=A0A838CWR3_9BACI|nr:hypothetical protein [Halobacillus locisalis]MBA2176056.1 hypothetical protein [Halobacillus locisalis]